MSSNQSKKLLMGFGIVAGLACSSASRSDEQAGLDREKAFLAENDTAMTHMMQGMMVKATGDVDRDFALMMIPHHQGAVDMAVAELRFGKNEQLRRLAQEIIVDQMQEIDAMRLAIGEKPMRPTSAPTGPQSAK